MESRSSKETADRIIFFTYFSVRDSMNTQRLKTLAADRQYTILPVKTGYQLEIHEKVGEGNNQRIWRFKGLVIKVKKPNHVDGTFTVRGKVAGMTIEKIYPLSFPNFEKVILMDAYKIRQAKIYYIREKIGKDARMKSISTADQRGLDLFAVAKGALPIAEVQLPDPQNDEDVTEQVVAEETAVEEIAVEEVVQNQDQAEVAAEESVEETPVVDVAAEEEAPVTQEASAEAADEVTAPGVATQESVQESSEEKAA